MTDVSTLGHWRSRREAFLVAEPARQLAMLTAASTITRRRILSTISGAGLGHVEIHGRLVRNLDVSRTAGQQQKPDDRGGRPFQCKNPPNPDG